MHARLYTFHVTGEQLDDVKTALDDAMADLARQPEFRGLLYLERGGDRPGVLGLTLWAGNGMKNTGASAERNRQQIADTADTGVSDRAYGVLRYLPYQGHDQRKVTTSTTPMMAEAG